jgi:hypothetical protein
MIDPIEHVSEGTKAFLDLAAFFAFILHIVGIALPQVLTAATLVWVLLRIFESSTVQGLIARWRKPKV